MRRFLAACAVCVVVLPAACRDETEGSGGSGGSGGDTTSSSTKTATATGTTVTSSATTTATTTTATTTTTTTATTTATTTSASTTSGMGGGGGGPGGEDCIDGVDNDGDMDVDCADLDCDLAPVCGTLVINEVDYDQPGADDFEFIEIYNAGLGPVDLTGVQLTLVNGSNGTVYDTIDLTGTLAADGYLVVADAGVVVDPQATVVALPGSIQNGAPDGVALYDTTYQVLLDALSYEGAVSNAMIDGLTFDLVETTATSAVDTDPAASLSLIRFPNGTDTNDASADWTTTTQLTPGAANAAGVVPEVCDNGTDDDGDLLADCEDTDCAAQSCGPNGLVCIGTTCDCMGGTTENACSDANDNDCDGLVDCADADCGGAPSCAEDCTDGVDNNGDLLADCADPLCDLQSCGPNGLTCLLGTCTCPGGSLPEANCSDGVDDDCDGQTDCADSDCALACTPPNLYFSEYVEGTSNRKALEIFNAGLTSVDLSVCTLERYSNGGTTPTNIALTGTVAGGDVFVICNSSGVQPGDAMGIPAASCDATSSALNHNGDDGYALVCNGTLLDFFGQLGVDPGAEWGTGLTSTADNTLRRLCSVTAGDTNSGDAFDPAAEWLGFATDTFDGLGARLCPGNP